MRIRKYWDVISLSVCVRLASTRICPSPSTLQHSTNRNPVDRTLYPTTTTTVTRVLTNILLPNAGPGTPYHYLFVPALRPLSLYIEQVDRHTAHMTLSNLSSCCYAFLYAFSRRQPHRASKPQIDMFFF
jgi:hypothetical protein